MLVRNPGAASHVPDKDGQKRIRPDRRIRRPRSADEIVRRLQARIVKAQQKGKHGQVKSLQWMLTHSHSGRVIAVQRVTSNKGGKTPGVDGETWQTPEKRAAGIATLRRRGYKPMPLRRIYIPKKNGKMRPLGIPTIRDRAMQALYLMALDPVAECTADGHSYGFRKERSCADAMIQCFLMLATSISPQWVLEGDIKACFDRISHDWLLANVPMDKGILKLWLKAGYIEKHFLHDTEEGTPQGGVISAALANLALDGLQELLYKRFGGRRGLGVNLIRYADDFVITGRSRELLESEVKPLVAEFLAARGLELSEEKTLITHIDQGFDFLGQNVRKYRGKYLSKPSKSSVHLFLEKIRKVLKENKAASAYVVIAILNPMITGWANYHRHAASKRTFNRVDSAIFEMIQRWCVRRHRAKNRRWVKARYFRYRAGPRGGDHWVFSGERTNVDGSVSCLALYNAAHTHIERHVKLRSEVNPYDPVWWPYLKKRHTPKEKSPERRAASKASSRARKRRPSGPRVKDVAVLRP